MRVPVRDEHRDDVGRMLGLDWELSGAPVTLARLRAKLAGADVDLADLLTATGGPVRDRPAERQQSEAHQKQLKNGVVATLTRSGVAAEVADIAVRRRWLGTDLPAAAKAADLVARAWSALPSPRGPTGGAPPR